MSTTLEYGKKILLKRMIKSIEQEGYKVEYAPDYEGFIIADKRDDPNIFLLGANIIEDMKNENAGKPAAFIEAVIRYVKNNISIGAASVPPSSEMATEAARRSSVPPTPSPVRSVPMEDDQEPVFQGEAVVEEADQYVDQGREQEIKDILESPTDSVEFGETDDVEEISNIIDDEGFKE